MGILVASSDTVSTPNWRTNHKFLFRLLLISLSFNILTVLFFAGKRYYYSHSNIANFFEQKTVNTVVLGDSRVAEGNWNKILHRKDVRNCGIGGITTAGFLKRLDTVYRYKPANCIIQIGINDIRSNANNDTTFFYYAQIIDSLLRHSIKPIATSIIPLRKDYWSDLLDENIVNLRADSLNHKIEQLCRQKNVIYVDINKKITDKNRLKRDYTRDGIHLNDSGYILIGQEIGRHLQKD